MASQNEIKMRVALGDRDLSENEIVAIVEIVIDAVFPLLQAASIMVASQGSPNSPVMKAAHKSLASAVKDWTME